jgi:hypothetical protein
MANSWKATVEVLELINLVKEKFHNERLADSSIVACFDESKPFIKGKINLGKVSKFSSLARLWQNQKHDFCLVICADLWHDVLGSIEREALIDLLLSRCEVELVPETIEENGKKKPVKDDLGRLKYTKEIKLDDEGNPKWKVAPLDLELFAKNVRRYGLWFDDLLAMKEAIDSARNEAVNELK